MKNLHPNAKSILATLIVVLAGIAVSLAADKPAFNKHQKEFYLTQQELAFIRPGLGVTIVDASIDTDGTIKARFTATDPRGLPLDRNGIFTPGPVSTSFVAAFIPRGEELYTSYTTRQQTSPITDVTETQASSDSGGTYEQVTPGVDGEYVYTFRTKAPMNFDGGTTHSVGVYARRDLTEFDLGQPSDDDVFTFVPDGSDVTTIRDIVRTETCNGCHTRLTLHGRRHSVELCILCHQPQSTDPDTGNTVDMATMIHKIHMGAELPSVQAGTPYQIIGFRQSVHDYSTVEFPADVRRCGTCHTNEIADEGVQEIEPAALSLATRVHRGRASRPPRVAHAPDENQRSHYLTKPSRRACGSCHDDVNFATGENHAGLPQVSDNLCANCHIPEGELEFDLSIIGAHTVEEDSKSLPGTNFEILSVTDTAPGRNPTVTFSIRDDEGNPILPSEVSRLNLYLAGNTTDIRRRFSEGASGAQGSGGVYNYTFEQPIPDDAQGSWAAGIEGQRAVTLLEGTLQERQVNDAGDNDVFAFPVTDADATPRRRVVDQQKCNGCHYDLALHGGPRKDVEFCVVCHMPLQTDANRRPDDQLPPESVNFKEMIHKIHTGEELSEEAKPYIIYGFGNTPHNFGEVRFPGDRSDCTICHIDGTQQLPLQKGLLATVTPRDFINPTPPITGACLSCHTGLSAAAHADLNTSPSFGESCEVCHGPTSDFSVDRVHAR